MVARVLERVNRPLGSAGITGEERGQARLPNLELAQSKSFLMKLIPTGVHETSFSSSRLGRWARPRPSDFNAMGDSLRDRIAKLWESKPVKVGMRSPLVVF